MIRISGIFGFHSGNRIMSEVTQEDGALELISVLYVDDEEDLLDISKIFLERSGEFHVDIVNSAVTALQSDKILSYDAIISDYMMPEMDGIAFLKSVRTLSRDMPFILFTGRGREEVVIEAINNGADFYLQKGGNPKAQFAELMHKIRQVVRRRQAEKDLSEQRIFNDAIFTSVPGLLYIYDEDGHLIRWNKNNESLTGFTTEELQGKHFLDWFEDPADKEQIKKAVEQTFREGSGSAQANISTKDGRKIPHFLTAVRVEIGDKKYFTGIGIDISPLKEAEKTIQERDEQYRRFARNAPDMIYRYSITEGRFLFVNPASSVLTGYLPEDFYQDPVLFDRIIHPSWKEVLDEKKRELFEGHSPIIFEYQIIDKDGKNHWLNQRKVLVRDEAGKPVAIEGIITDISSIKQADEELRRSEQRFDAVTRNAGSWIWEIDTEGIYRYSNPAVFDILGYHPDEIVGKMHFLDTFDPSIRDTVAELSLTIFRERENFKNFENLNRHKDGSIVLLSTCGSPVYNEKGEFSGYWGVDEDITEQVKTRDALKQANQKLSMLASVTRHDILNKIAVIKGYLAVVSMEFETPELMEYVRMMKSATASIQSQIEFTRTYQNLGTEEPVWINLQSILPVSQVPDEIIMSIHLPDVAVFADQMIEKVFFNLLDNSTRHGKNVTELVVSGREQQDGFLVTWEDNGVGIPEEEKNLIFERGYGKNTGLGLFLAREILSLTEAVITETGEPGKGARFELLFSKGNYRIL
ncbi:hypothetical protein DLD82_04070 [Methanospirillum stamsii]|uniref:histidine kinase n=2 Tax=Methanospirillum stamsii TaxID=1277351 RepID=A0A2V2N9Y8_9EURY|nr:hypothetical protein DLD82_04070 [Methanospirillum stamsii]